MKSIKTAHRSAGNVPTESSSVSDHHKRFFKVQSFESEAESHRLNSPEEDLAICLMMLSRDATWDQVKDELKKTNKKVPSKGKFKCESCMKRYRSSRALTAHRRICRLDKATAVFGQEKIFECPYCFRLFGSGQALGGHKRSHLLSMGARNEEPLKKPGLLDLNLPASPEDDDFSVVLEA